MRAKLVVSHVDSHIDSSQGNDGKVDIKTIAETVKFHAVCKKDGYTGVGEDENNTYARFSPSANLRIYIANPNLFGKFRAGQEFYVDFTEAATPAPAAA